MGNLEKIELSSWEEQVPLAIKQKAIKALEHGKVLYFPGLEFPLHEDEKHLLSPDKTDPNSKNISYDRGTGKLSGTQCSEQEAHMLKEMIRRYACCSRGLLEQLLPSYIPFLTQARTSFRPVEIAGRKTTYRKDDTLLHVDSFPATPTKGKRIMRVFTNINPNSKPRVWRIGEPFPEVVKKMAPQTRKMFPGFAYLLKTIGITKDYRTPYDHYMLQIHNRMKGDPDYQKFVDQEEILFMPGDTWIVYTDQVSHAAMSGQHVLEQTFYLPSTAMQNQGTTPLAVLEKYFNTKLV